MKKLYMLGLVLMLASLTGCTLKAPTLPQLSTGDTQLTTVTESPITELTGIELTGTEVTESPIIEVMEPELTGIADTGVLAEEITEPIDAVVVPMVEGSEDLATQETGIATQVKKLIEERNTQAKDESKINESDIDLWQKIIDLFK